MPACVLSAWRLRALLIWCTEDQCEMLDVKLRHPYGHGVQAVMEEPMIAADGHTYERSALQQWLKQHSTSPVTGSSLAHHQMVPNLVIKTIAIQWDLTYCL